MWIGVWLDEWILGGSRCVGRGLRTETALEGSGLELLTRVGSGRGGRLDVRLYVRGMSRLSGWAACLGGVADGAQLVGQAGR